MKPFDQLTAADLEALIANGAEESRELEFKREVPSSSGKDKHELCADVSSFANTAGGYLLYGIEEKEGVAAQIPGLSNVDADAKILWLGQTIEAGIDPRLHVEIRAIPLDNGGKVIAIHVPRSWRAPHLVRSNGSFRMYARTSRGKQPLDAQEIRRAFESTGDMVSAIRRWRDDRIAQILGGETPVPLQEGPKLVLHLVPFGSFLEQFRISASELRDRREQFVPPDGCYGQPHRINLEGYFTSFSYDRSSISSSYCQAFRSGRIETVECHWGSKDNGQTIIASMAYERKILEATARYLEALSNLDVGYPISVMLTILEARGAEMFIAPGTQSGRYFSHRIDRDVVLLPDILLEHQPDDLPRALRPMFDAVWNACGLPSSNNYDQKGNWIGEPLGDVPHKKE